MDTNTSGVSGDSPKIRLSAPDGARAEIYLHGGHVTSWITPDGYERLFLSQRAEFQPGAALRGGVPVCFPQFSGMGPLLKHGFARITPWQYLGAETDAAGSAVARFQLRDTQETRRLWDHGFQLDLAVAVGGPRLDIRLQVTNTDAQPFDFTAALHTYFRVQDIAAVMVEGLGGRPYREFGVDGIQREAELRIVGEIDRIYWNVPGPVTLHDTRQTVRVTAGGFPDAVVWNPGPDKGAALSDLEPEGYRHMLCIEAAVIGQPVRLPPDGVWRGNQLIEVTNLPNP
jgi:glucose-6-phosphate 1-epimerase